MVGSATTLTFASCRARAQSPLCPCPLCPGWPLSWLAPFPPWAGSGADEVRGVFLALGRGCGLGATADVPESRPLGPPTPSHCLGPQPVSPLLTPSVILTVFSCLSSLFF